MADPSSAAPPGPPGERAPPRVRRPNGGPPLDSQQQQATPSTVRATQSGGARRPGGGGRNRAKGGGAVERDVVVGESSAAQGGGGPNAGGGGRRPNPRAQPPHQRQPDSSQPHDHAGHAHANPGGLAAPRASRRAGFGGQLSSSASTPAQNSPTATSSPASSVAGGNNQQMNAKERRRPPKKAEGGGDGERGGGRGQAHGPTLPKPKDDDDLTTRLIWAVGNPPFPDCPICFNSIFPTQAIWSCTPAPPSAFDEYAGIVDGAKDGEIKLAGEGNCCWGIFHLKCINDWASRSVKELQAIPNREGEPEWRCPGCQTKRFQVPKKYSCFCHRQLDPKPSRLATPHSCGTGCSRSRWTSNCHHPCPLECHPGPCPPCSVSMLIPCGSHSTPILTRCSHRTQNAPPTCGEVCSRSLNCGDHSHRCKELCHDGPCEPCSVKETLTCFCGAETKEGSCGEGKRDEVRCLDETGEKEWAGRWACDQLCDRTYDCGVHKCKESCHPHSSTISSTHETCPLSPSVVKTCPCGSKALDKLPVPPRRNCEDPIPTCQSKCGKELGGCGHACEAKCHTDKCPPCTVEITLPCRCGESKVTRQCWVRKKEEAEGLSEIRCERVCRALRTCSKHQCGRACCPLAYKSVKSKGKKRADELGEDDEGGWHTCSLVCGKQLSCGNHACPSLDHKGPCPPCLEASYDELICHCRRTVVYPPIPCGRHLTCTYPCARPPPACGHPKAPHTCHESESCPPCIFLTAKNCSCGKSQVKNVRCSQDKVSCGQVCGELLGCGWHRCEKTCHAAGEHEICSKPCGKPRKVCGHGCQAACHSPAGCDESVACPATVFQSCACGRIQVQAMCGASTSNPTSRSRVVLKCIDECQRALRNERLAAALGISKNRTDKTSVEWPAEVIQLAGTMGATVVAQLEKALNDFVNGSRPTQVLPHSPLSRREFTQKLAEVYRLQTDMVDQDPVRSVRIQRRVDSRIPHPLLTAYLAEEAAAKLTAKKPSLLTTNLARAPLPVRVPQAAPKPNPWGATPLTSAGASPSGSRPGSPYVPPGARGKPAAALDPVAKAFVPTTPVVTAQTPTTTAPPPGLTSEAVASGSELKAEARPFVPVPAPAPAPPHADAKDDTWENSDDEGGA